ncbi:hypothetical protein K402DRAFT_391396 [Aulographum hederae CBS 113979]|uniref:RING-type domain-containing protein n=1 Tax=Aulographum hederae CBS 113979 TaxID=1176131 RepID=A0A6G1H635_9PEZI|nr:hypothetical protein K402DRAFT_391396 [Aulographum hederae CBS 113979]
MSPTLPDNAIWDPFKVLEIYDPSACAVFSCSGYAPSQRRRCRLAINQFDHAEVRDVLCSLSVIPPSSSRVESRLRGLLEDCLCWNYHRGDLGQRVRLLEEWKSRVSVYSASLSPRSFASSHRSSASSSSSHRSYESSSSSHQSSVSSSSSHRSSVSSPSTHRSTGSSSSAHSSSPPTPPRTPASRVPPLARTPEPRVRNTVQQYEGPEVPRRSRHVALPLSPPVTPLTHTRRDGREESTTQRRSSQLQESYGRPAASRTESSSSTRTRSGRDSPSLSALQRPVGGPINWEVVFGTGEMDTYELNTDALLPWQPSAATNSPSGAFRRWILGGDFGSPRESSGYPRVETQSSSDTSSRIFQPLSRTQTEASSRQEGLARTRTSLNVEDPFVDVSQSLPMTSTGSPVSSAATTSPSRGATFDETDPRTPFRISASSLQEVLPSTPLHTPPTVTLQPLASTPSTPTSCTTPHVIRRPLTSTCSICNIPLPPLLLRQLVWCKTQCGQNFCKSCISLWHVEQVLSGRRPECPMCRADWAGECVHDMLPPPWAWEGIWNEDDDEGEGVDGRWGLEGLFEVRNHRFDLWSLEAAELGFEWLFDPERHPFDMWEAGGAGLERLFDLEEHPFSLWENGEFGLENLFEEPMIGYSLWEAEEHGLTRLFDPSSHPCDFWTAEHSGLSALFDESDSGTDLSSADLDEDTVSAAASDYQATILTTTSGWWDELLTPTSSSFSLSWPFGESSTPPSSSSDDRASTPSTTTSELERCVLTPDASSLSFDLSLDGIPTPTTSSLSPDSFFDEITTPTSTQTPSTPESVLPLLDTVNPSASTISLPSLSAVTESMLITFWDSHSVRSAAERLDRLAGDSVSQDERRLSISSAETVSAVTPTLPCLELRTRYEREGRSLGEVTLFGWEFEVGWIGVGGAQEEWCVGVMELFGWEFEVGGVGGGLEV